MTCLAHGRPSPISGPLAQVTKRKPNDEFPIGSLAKQVHRISLIKKENCNMFCIAMLVEYNELIKKWTRRSMKIAKYLLMEIAVFNNDLI